MRRAGVAGGGAYASRGSLAEVGSEPEPRPEPEPEPEPELGCRALGLRLQRLGQGCFTSRTPSLPQILQQGRQPEARVVIFVVLKNVSAYQRLKLDIYRASRARAPRATTPREPRPYLGRHKLYPHIWSPKGEDALKSKSKQLDVWDLTNRRRNLGH